MVRGEVSAEKFMESDTFFAIRDANPRTDGHSLIIPKNHYKELSEFPDKFGKELMGFIKEVSKSLIDSGFGDSFNLIVNNGKSAGQIVMHLHFHILPRKEGDGVKVFEKH